MLVKSVRSFCLVADTAALPAAETVEVNVLVETVRAGLILAHHASPQRVARALV